MLAFAWQALTVHYNFEGNWTALFHTGDRRSVPPALASEDVYRFPQTFGYDAQFYHYIAHSPFDPKEFEEYVDGPGLRWQRIVVPALAHALALGNSMWVDAAFLTVILGFLFLGAYWMSVYAVRAGRHAAWGVGYLLAPATMIGVERLTIDLAFVSLCVGYVVFAESRSAWKVVPFLVLSPLVRETGLLLCIADTLLSIGRRQWGRAAGAVLSSVPFFVWLEYVQTHSLPDRTQWTSWIPLYGMYERTLHPVARYLAGVKDVIASALDYVAVLGVWLALALVLYLLWSRKSNPIVFALATFMLATTFVANSKVWAEAYAFGRHVSPVLVWLAMLGLSYRKWWMSLPLLMFVPRIGAQLGTHLPGIFRGLLGF